MKIRTITTGFNVELPLKEGQISHVADFTNKARRLFESNGYEVQTVRIATQPWERYFESRGQIVSLVKALEDLTHKYCLDYSNVGTTFNAKLIPIIYDMMEKE